MLSDRQAIELFHLHFLRHLASGMAKGSFALKGGCNLRFFFGSVRYSEDMDIDAADLPVFELKDRVSRILQGQALTSVLRSRGIGVGAFSTPKQTETTQRWKIALALTGRELPLHTKIEFSRRTTTEEVKTESVDREILAEYQLMPILVRHYPLDAALRQKVGALANRAVVQARDVFDLAVLFARAGGRIDALEAVRHDVPRALDRAMDISWEEFQSQVVSFLRSDHQELYATREAWNAIQTEVVERLGSAS